MKKIENNCTNPERRIKLYIYIYVCVCVCLYNMYKICVYMFRIYRVRYSMRIQSKDV